MSFDPEILENFLECRCLAIQPVLSVQQHIEKRMQDEYQDCFACHVNMFEGVRVTPEHDLTLTFLRKSHLLDHNFNGDCFDNHVPLCPNFHKLFDRPHDPGLIFFPKDISFFIEKEIEFRQKNPGMRSLGPVKRVPTVQEYRDHMVSHGSVHRWSESNLNSIFFLRCLETESFSSRRRTQPICRAWHRTPFAAFKRAFAALGTPGISSIPLDIVSQLWRLRDFYYRDDVDCDHMATIPRALGSDVSGRKNDATESEQSSKAAPTPDEKTVASTKDWTYPLSAGGLELRITASEAH